MRWLVFIFLCVPHVVDAAVSFSEVAWMGTTVSANHEWIELHNDGAAIDVTGWTIEDGMNLSIDLVGTLSAGEYAVLERTSDDTVAGSAFLIYTGSLVNTGATLTLRRADGSLVDRVVGGADWESIGGDNVTKETAQYTNSGWVTAPPTPAAAFAGTVSEPESNGANDSKSKTVSRIQSNSSSETAPLVLPGVTLELSVVAPTLAYVNQPIEFTVIPAGVGETIKNSLVYQWNFGDGTAAVGKDQAHAFLFPGTYVVTVQGEFKRQHNLARHEITVVPVMFSLTTDRDGNLQIHNNAKYEVDMSGYRVVGDEVTFTFPPHSFVLSQQTVTLPERLVGESNNRMVALYDQNDTLVASRLPAGNRLATPTTQTLAAAVPAGQVSSVAVSRASAAPAESFGFASAEVTPADQMVVSSPQTNERVQAASAVQSQTKNPSDWPYLGLVGLLVLVVGSILLTARRNEML